MALELNAKCEICGKMYHMCNSCADSLTFKPWRSVVDSIEHFKIYIVLSDYTNKHISKGEAKQELEKCNISDYKTFEPHIVKAIDEILKDDKQVTNSTISTNTKTTKDNNKVSYRRDTK